MSTCCVTSFQELSYYPSYSCLPSHLCHSFPSFSSLLPYFFPPSNVQTSLESQEIQTPPCSTNIIEARTLYCSEYWCVLCTLLWTFKWRVIFILLLTGLSGSQMSYYYLDCMILIIVLNFFKSSQETWSASNLIFVVFLYVSFAEVQKNSIFRDKINRIEQHKESITDPYYFHIWIKIQLLFTEKG